MRDYLRVFLLAALVVLAFDTAASAGAGGFHARRGDRETGRAACRGTPHVYFEVLL
jgi:hypothetical protein